MVLRLQGIFASYPFFSTGDVRLASLVMDQMLGSALLVLIILAATDSNNMNIPRSRASYTKIRPN